MQIPVELSWPLSDAALVMAGSLSLVGTQLHQVILRLIVKMATFTRNDFGFVLFLLSSKELKN